MSGEHGGAAVDESAVGADVSDAGGVIEHARRRAIARVHAAFDRARELAEDDADGPRRSVAASLACVGALGHVADRATADAALAAVDVARGGGSDGLLRATVADELATEGGWDGAAARRLHRAARRLTWMPALARRVADGSIAWAAAQGITDAARSLTVAELDVLDRALDTHLADRDSMTTDDLLRTCDDAVAQIRPDLENTRADRTHGRRFVAITDRLDGSGSLYAELDAEGLSTVAAAIDGAVHDARSGGSDESNRSDESTGPSWTRRGRDRADGLTTIADRYLAGAADGPARPSVTLSADLDRAARPSTGHDRPSRQTPGARAAATLTGPLAARITDTALRRLTCDADIRIVGVDGIEVLGVGRTTRTVPAWLRDVLATRDGGCRWAGCTTAAGRCHAHHIIHWAAHGPTDADNLVLLCPRHHRAVHEGGWTVRLDDDGTVHSTRGRRRLTSRPRLARTLHLDGLPTRRPRHRSQRDPSRTSTSETRAGPPRASAPDAPPQRTLRPAGHTDLPF